MRQVQVFKWEKQQIDGKWKNITVPAFIGAFHQFGQEADGEGQSNPVAIVEAADGQVHSVHVTMMKFMEPAPAVVRPMWVDAALAAKVQLKQWMAAHGQDIGSQEAIKQIDAALASTGAA